MVLPKKLWNLINSPKISDILWYSLAFMVVMSIFRNLVTHLLKHVFLVWNQSTSQRNHSLSYVTVISFFMIFFGHLGWFCRFSGMLLHCDAFIKTCLPWMKPTYKSEKSFSILFNSYFSNKFDNPISTYHSYYYKFIYFPVYLELLTPRIKHLIFLLCFYFIFPGRALM